MPSQPTVTATYLSDTQVELNFTQPIGTVDYYILTSDPEMIDPVFSNIGPSLTEGKAVGPDNVQLLNLEIYRAYTFIVSIPFLYIYFPQIQTPLAFMLLYQKSVNIDSFVSAFNINAVFRRHYYSS